MARLHSRSPGVYLEEIFPTPAPELLTGVCAFLGFADTGAVNIPQALTLWTQFTASFGRSAGYLSSAVYGFFNNGGQLCYVIRLDPNLPVENALAQGLDAIAPLDRMDLVCAPDIVHPTRSSEQIRRMQQAVLDHCDQLGDRFAILDAGYDLSLDAVQHQQRSLSSANAALYFPWIQDENQPIGSFVPPCGHVAGVFARSDRAVGVHQLPANYALEGVLDVKRALTNADQFRLNPDLQVAGINCLRAFPGRGIRVWGGRTLSTDANWRYINVRRLFLTVVRWVELRLADVAFEPNEVQLWIRIERELNAFCETLLQQGALQGRVPQEAFFVKCNAETNPPEERDRGRVITEIGLAPTLPNEFIVVRLIHGTSGVTAA
ncbi:phage tail sheath family protein [Myxacorys almedinensis]|uniref:Phage tail sheath family protein n=1 Tax=Myxacorys almedinensis A TaxID=2690445 RepID=A0A8J7Z1J7_9CYAN|nr:phage tail sheath subtilisin-like domain-containing protein [Myxacorys almedinensis]NDJ16471.1 phage tail sheath family protein [Myxacorys almedinensis A]